MKKLTPEQLDKLHGLLIRNGANDALTTELVDHLACEVEAYMWKGYNFDLALEKVREEANVKAIKYLRETYQQDLIMTEAQLQEATLDDIVFQFRNKAYGAYELRRAYPVALFNALVFGVGLFLTMMAILSGIAQKQWSLFSLNGLMWVAGLSGIAYASWNWFVQSQRKKYFSHTVK